MLYGYLRIYIIYTRPVLESLIYTFSLPKYPM